MNREEALQFCDRWLPLWTGNRPEPLAGLYAEDVFYRDPLRPEGIRGRAALLDHLRHLLARNPDWRWIAEEVFETPGGFFLRWRATIPVGGETVTETGLDLVLVRDGHIIRNDVFFDFSGLLRARQKAGAAQRETDATGGG